MIIKLNEEELSLALAWGKRRAAIMANKANKAGYPPGTSKGTTLHTAVQQEALAIAAEIAGCKLVGMDYLDPNVYTAVAELDADGKLPASCKQPDVAGIWEIRRAENPNYPIRMWPKDKNANAFVVQAVVWHEHIAQGTIRPTGDVEFIGWLDAAKDYDKCTRMNGYVRRHVKNPMETLPGLAVAA